MSYGIEIEKKYLVKDDSWRGLAEGILYRQGYLSSGQGPTVRVRLVGNTGYLTIKGRSSDFSSHEFEYQIPPEEANALLETLATSSIIEKFRHKIDYDGFTWEVDEFLGENLGLIMAEIELEAEDQDFPLPAWIGEEVTGDGRYYNASLARNPYTNWSEG